MFSDPAKFNMYDTNRDGLVDAPEYGTGEGFTEHRCKYESYEYIRSYRFFVHSWFLISIQFQFILIF